MSSVGPREEQHSDGRVRPSSERNETAMRETAMNESEKSERA
jgi:hypothetical protein